ncbi:hypothetical protein DFP92_10632 [Yoonia sediminilitoris]|uniref:Uncharacterized protein n=1 Tax=Yoonia sediminilitoris TaxID=1286148 RepID=A0A2T6KFP1_9RHOB|nr:hypothetical protein C8N45_10632 [Yoonia sediminilitoris]RCW95090.1 hypothetical protein DFP92_10632 [Yoonia sediminilitoris]
MNKDRSGRRNGAHMHNSTLTGPLPGLSFMGLPRLYCVAIPTNDEARRGPERLEVSRSTQNGGQSTTSSEHRFTGPLVTRKQRNATCDLDCP